MSVTERASTAGTAIVAASPETAWHVNAGEAVVFIVEIDADGAPQGRRSYLGAVAAGDTVFGMTAPNTQRHALLLTGARDALEPIAVETMSFSDRDAAVVSCLALAFGAIAEPLDRKHETALSLQRGPVEIEAGERVIASSPIVYARFDAGAATYFGFALTAGDVIAVTPQHGLNVTAATTLEVLGRPEDIALEDVAAAVAIAGAALWSRWFTSSAQEDEHRRERQRVTRTYDTVALERALDDAAAVFDAHAIPFVSDPDAIVATARIVARASGVAIEAPSQHYTETEAMVRAIAEASRVPIRRVALRGRWWRREGGPMLAFAGETPVALLPAHGGRRYMLVEVDHPAHRTLVDAAVAARLDPIGYLFVRTLPPRAIGLRDIVRVAAPGGGGDLWRIVAFGFSAGLLGAVVPVAIGLVYGLSIPNGLRGSLGLVAAGLVLVGGTATAIEIVRNLLVLRLQTRASSSAQAAVMARLVSLPAAFFRRYAVGDLADRALAVDTIQRYVTGTTLSVALSAVFSLTGFIVVLAYDARLAIVCAVLAALAVGMALTEAFLTLPLYRELSMRGGAIAAHVLQLVAGIAKLRVSRAEPRAFVGWLERFVAMRRLATRAGTIGYRFGIFQALWPAVATLAIVADVAIFRTQTLSAAAFLAISAAFGQLLGALLGLGDALTSIVRVVPIYERAKPLLDAVPEIQAGHGDPGRISGSIVLRRVAFSYQEGRRILDQIDLTIGRGEFVAIVGSSGSGKSTLFRLLLGFEQPEEGAILFDGHDLAALDLGAVRRQIGCVLQTAKTIPGSIFENIACGTILSRDEAWEAARSVGLATDISQMPMGMETMIGDDGGGLSGGQRQRILIARALAHKPRIILFDEATSALDNQTQAMVTASLRDMRATRVVIAHRLSTIIDADRIVVLDRGRIVQTGTYDELVAVPGAFAELAARQRL